ncbi:MAG: pdxH [Solirubrobacterales bacterium]|nr:pdxH [Solirubrobacterales bacterium]
MATPTDPVARLAAMRRSYAAAGLEEADLAPTWLEQFERWFEDAVAAPLVEANAMVLATADPRGRPSARTVLLKGVDEGGFAFYTNRESRKGRESAENPWAAIVFPWYEMGRQVIVDGSVEQLTDAESDAYFASRPRDARLGAVASPQSHVIASREELDRAHAELAARYPEGTDVPRPPHWGGLRVVPETVEFWQGRRSRLHDRLRYRRERDAWVLERLAP